MRAVKRTSRLLIFQEDPRIASAAGCLITGLACLEMLFWLPVKYPGSERVLLPLAVLALPAGVNRLLGTQTTFDFDSGIVSVNRMLAGIVVFRRAFSMDSIRRMFNDRRSYIRPRIKNPVLQLSSGRQIRLAQWCPTEFDFEAETYAANRLLYRWKQKRAATTGKTAGMPAELFGESSPRDWSITDITEMGRSSDLLFKRIFHWSGLGLIAGLILLFSLGGWLDGPVRNALVLFCFACTMSGLVSGGVFLVAALSERFEKDPPYHPPKPRSGRRRPRPASRQM